MWNSVQFFQVFISVREKAKQKIFLPLLVHTGSLTAFLQDYADVLGLLPAATVAGGGESHAPRSMGQLVAMLRMTIALLQESHGLRVKVNARDQDDDVHMDIRAL